MAQETLTHIQSDFVFIFVSADDPVQFGGNSDNTVQLLYVLLRDWYLGSILWNKMCESLILNCIIFLSSRNLTAGFVPFMTKCLSISEQYENT